ncbi:hypothetical protein BKA80DRAFT_276731 [Phyllosticta citrichinensis]
MKLSERISKVLKENARLADERDRAMHLLKISQKKLHASDEKTETTMARYEERAQKKTEVINKLLQRFQSAMDLVKEKDDTIKLQDDLIETQRALIRSLEKSERCTGR